MTNITLLLPVVTPLPKTDSLTNHLTFQIYTARALNNLTYLP